MCSTVGKLEFASVLYFLSFGYRMICITEIYLDDESQGMYSAVFLCFFGQL